MHTAADMAKDNAASHTSHIPDILGAACRRARHSSAAAVAHKSMVSRKIKRDCVVNALSSNTRRAAATLEPSDNLHTTCQFEEEKKGEKKEKINKNTYKPKATRNPECKRDQ